MSQESIDRELLASALADTAGAAGGEHPRWVVKGGNFLKYGVTCWPEVLEAAGIAEKLDPLKENTPRGLWVAHYSERQTEDGRWAPDKVLRLERSGT